MRERSSRLNVSQRIGDKQFYIDFEGMHHFYTVFSLLAIRSQPRLGSDDVVVLKDDRCLHLSTGTRMPVYGEPTLDGVALRR